MDLWKIAFGDSNKFISLFFDRVYKDENALIIEKQGRILSALHMLPYRMTYYGEEITVAYISGACTLPSEQGKGLMKQLLHNAFEEMKRRNIAVTALIPAEKWLFNYYRSQGYTEVFEYSLKVYTRHEYLQPERDLTILKCTKTTDETLFSYFDRKLHEREACILHAYDDFITILKDLKIVGGKLFVAYDLEMNPVGMAFVTPPDKRKMPDSVMVKEILYKDERIKKHLLFEITKYFKVFKAVYRIPFCEGMIAYPFGMARVIDIERLTGIWKASHSETVISEKEMRKMNIQTLTSLLFDYTRRLAYMSLMLD